MSTKRGAGAIACALILIGSASTSAHANTCSSLLLQPMQMDYGWKGFAHDRSWPEDSSFRLGITSRCGGTGATCTDDADCESDACQPTCSADAGTDEICEYTSAGLTRRCIADMSRTCDSDADCADSGTLCVTFLGAPLPLVTDGFPVCVTPFLVQDATGTVDMSSGASSLDLTIRWRVHLGLDLPTPCPRCSPSSVEEPGAAGLCEGGPANGNACTIDAVGAPFGATSYDCPPPSNANISGLGLYIGFGRASTGPHSATAKLPCGFPLDNVHPYTGSPICLDDFGACESNDDCADAPCGVYCHCGFCDEGFGPDPDSPCMSDDDCETGACSVDPSRDDRNQARPNGCESLVCGQSTAERCCTAGDSGCDIPSPLIGTCSVIPVRCTSSSECMTGGRGNECVFAPRKCFENTIDDSGTRTAASDRCTSQTPAVPCTTDADCEIGTCESLCPAARLQLLACAPASASAGYNSAVGLPGPLRLDVLASLGTEEPGICGDGVRQTGEDCDDANADSYDGCSPDCSLQPRCGDVDGTPGLTATDALLALQLAIGLSPPFVCACDILACADFNGDLKLTASDALTYLNVITGVVIEPNCPPCA